MAVQKRYTDEDSRDNKMYIQTRIVGIIRYK